MSYDPITLLVMVLKLIAAAIAIVNPFLVTAAAIGATVFLLRKPALRPYRLRILIGAAIAFAIYVAIDTAFAYRRVQYGNALPNRYVSPTMIDTPRSIVLVNVPCDQACLERLADGVHDEVIDISTIRYDNNARVEIDPPYPAERYTLVQADAGACPPYPGRAGGRPWGPEADNRIRTRGLCPRIEPVAAPSEGLFIVREGERVTANERAVHIAPRFLQEKPPGRIIVFFGTEAQKRTGSSVEVFASSYTYEAPGYLGLVPLLGCWARPDNVIWIMPGGDTGCGFWRLMTSGGRQQGHPSDTSWIYLRLFK